MIGSVHEQPSGNEQRVRGAQLDARERAGAGLEQQLGDRIEQHARQHQRELGSLHCLTTATKVGAVYITRMGSPIRRSSA